MANRKPVRVGTTCDIFWRSPGRGHFRLRPSSSEPNTRRWHATFTRSKKLKREADIAIGLSRPEHMRVVSRRLTDYRMYVYGSLAYLEKATPIVTMPDLKNHPFIGYVEELLFAPELSFAEATFTA